MFSYLKKKIQMQIAIIKTVIYVTEDDFIFVL